MAIKKHKNKKWKPVYIDPSILASGNFDDLAGIEELSDYKVLNAKSKVGKKSNIINKKRNQKNKPLKSVHEQELDNSKINYSSNVQKHTENRKRKIEVDDSVPKKKKKRSSNFSQPEVDPDDSVPKKKKKRSSNFNQPEVDHLNSSQEQDMAAWKNLFVPEPVLKALAELGFTAPTPIQALSLPAAIRDKMDILGAAETGSGKTLAFGIPLLNHILNDKVTCSQRTEKKTDEELPRSSPLRALILTPTRELAIQVKNHIQAAAKYTDIKIAVVVGGMASQKQQRLLKKCPEIVVATPGRLWELFEEGVPHLNQVPDIKYLVIDEADRMVEKGHFSELKHLFELISKNGNYQRQTFVFSATLTMIHDTPKRLLMRKKMKINQEQKLNMLIELVGLKNKPKVIDITRKTGTVETLTEARINCTLENKDTYLYYFWLMHPGRTLVFCNSIDCVRRLRNVLDLLGCNPLPLHASMHQKQRLKNLEKFAANSHGLLLATDVAARGLDIKGVEHIVHFQVPRTAEVYVHRSGRTARAQHEGLSLMLIESQEILFYRRICNTLNRNADLPLFPVENGVLKGVKERVSLARKIDHLEHRSKRLSAQNRWFVNAAKEAMIELDDDLLNDLGDEGQQASHTRELKIMKSKLNALLQQPVMPEGIGKYPTKSGKLLQPLYYGLTNKKVNIK